MNKWSSAQNQQGLMFRTYWGWWDETDNTALQTRGFELRAPAVRGRPRHLSVTEAPHSLRATRMEPLLHWCLRPYPRTSYDISQASVSTNPTNWPRWPSRPIRSLRYIATCPRIRGLNIRSRDELAISGVTEQGLLILPHQYSSTNHLQWTKKLQLGSIVGWIRFMPNRFDTCSFVNTWILATTRMIC